MPSTRSSTKPTTPWLHPLSGSDPATLLSALVKNGFVPPHQAPRVAMALAATLSRWPLSMVERLGVALRRRTMRPYEPPVFIIGHWRSGTTHLYNVLSRSPQFGYVTPFATGLPWDFLRLGRVLAPLLKKALPEHRFIDRIPVHADSPQEDETALANMQTVSFYHGLYFPSRFRERFNEGVFFDGCSRNQIKRWQQRFTYFLDKIALLHPGRQLLIKNPVYTTRVSMLRDLYPGAKFIHIYRNPYRVFLSTRRFYRVLFEELALQPYDHVPIEEIILNAYPRMMDRVIDAGTRLPEHDFVEVCFEDFDERPMAECARIYASLRLDGFEEAVPHFSAYLSSIDAYQKNTYELSASDRARVSRRWQPYINRWNYSEPAVERV